MPSTKTHEHGHAHDVEHGEWFQLHEIVKMLEVSVAQLELAMAEGDESVETLIQAVTTMGGELRNLPSQAKAFANDTDITCKHTWEELNRKLRTAVVELQFFMIACGKDFLMSVPASVT